MRKPTAVRIPRIEWVASEEAIKYALKRNSPIVWMYRDDCSPLINEKSRQEVEWRKVEFPTSPHFFQHEQFAVLDLFFSHRTF